MRVSNNKMIINGNSPTYDIIIPVEEKDVDFLPRVITYLDKYLSGFGNIYILSHQRNFKKIKKLTEDNKYCIFLNENEVIRGIGIDMVRDLLRTKNPQYDYLAGWYFQQFLKLGFSLSPYCSEYYLSWDADTLPLSSITFFEGKQILYNPKAEYHENYFKTINKLLGIGRIPEKSFISESMMFSSSVVRELIDKISSSAAEGDNWVEKIIRACDFTESPQAFSEFETYGNYCAAMHPELYRQRHLNTFRHAGMISGRHISEKKLEKLSFDLDMVSFEFMEWPMFPYNIPDMICYYKRLFRKLGRMPLDEAVRRLIAKCKRAH